MGCATVKILIGGLVTFVLIIVAGLTVFWLTGCPKEGFQCPNGKCLPMHRFCDLIPECPEREDEEQECIKPKMTILDGKPGVEEFPFCYLCYCNSSNAEDCIKPQEENTRWETCNSMEEQTSILNPKISIQRDPSEAMVRKSQESTSQQQLIRGRRATTYIQPSQFHKRYWKGQQTLGQPSSLYPGIPDDIQSAPSSLASGLPGVINGVSSSLSSGYPDALQSLPYSLSSSYPADIPNLPSFLSSKFPDVIPGDTGDNKHMRISQSRLLYDDAQMDSNLNMQDWHDYATESKENLYKTTMQEGKDDYKSAGMEVEKSRGRKMRKREFLFDDISPSLPSHLTIFDEDKIDDLLSHEYKYDIISRNARDLTDYHALEDSLDYENGDGVAGFEGCYCEIKYILKCKNTNFTKVPTNIYGGIRWLDIEGSDISSLEQDTMVQYPELRFLAIMHSLLTFLPNGTFAQQKTMKALRLSCNKIEDIAPMSLVGLDAVENIYLDNNKLTNIPLQMFRHTPNITEIDLSYNSLHFCANQSFPKLNHLETLDMNFNKIQRLDFRLLQNLQYLKTLRLTNNEITDVDERAFNVFVNLTVLHLSGNKLHSINGLFKKHHPLYVLLLENMPLNGIQKDHFKNLTSLKVVYFPAFRYCRYIPHVPKCIPNHDGLSDLHDLWGWKSIRAGLWIVAVFTILSNSLVILFRCSTKKSRKDAKEKNIYFLISLAGSDLLMGIYFVIIGVNDAKMRGVFGVKFLEWAQSETCTLAGIIAAVSSETSVFILTFMSLERYLCIAHSMKGFRPFSARKKIISLLVIWLVSLTLAIFPALYIESYYGTNTMCFPVHIIESYAAGWQYSTCIYLGLNSICLILIIWSDTSLFYIRYSAIKQTTLNIKDTFRIRYFFIVLTNCLCWLPIIALKAAALAGVEINGSVYAWLVILVLPLNSALNPILHTFSILRLSKKLEKISKTIIRFRNSLRRQSSDTDMLPKSSSHSFSTCNTSLQNHCIEVNQHEHKMIKTNNHVLPEETSHPTTSQDVLSIEDKDQKSTNTSARRFGKHCKLTIPPIEELKNPENQIIATVSEIETSANTGISRSGPYCINNQMPIHEAEYGNNTNGKIMNKDIDNNSLLEDNVFSEDDLQSKGLLTETTNGVTKNQRKVSAEPLDHQNRTLLTSNQQSEIPLINKHRNDSVTHLLPNLGIGNQIMQFLNKSLFAYYKDENSLKKIDKPKSNESFKANHSERLEMETKE